jgi:hypothetical protein
MNVSNMPAERIPITTQAMCEVSAEDYEHDQIMLEIARSQPDAMPEIIARRERRLRLRLAICNAIDFLITNKADISAVIAERKRKA